MLNEIIKWDKNSKCDFSISMHEWILVVHVHDIIILWMCIKYYNESSSLLSVIALPTAILYFRASLNSHYNKLKETLWKFLNEWKTL